MPEIDRWSECLSGEMRAVWPTLAAATRGLDGSLVGGTAPAIHLRHRPSFDLDFMTLGSFSGARVAQSLRSLTEDVVVSSVVANAVCGADHVAADGDLLVARSALRPTTASAAPISLSRPLRYLSSVALAADTSASL